MNTKHTLGTCRNCAHFDIEKVKDTAGRVHRNRTARCLWPIPTLPASAYNIHISLNYMQPDSGSECPCFKATGSAS